MIERLCVICSSPFFVKFLSKKTQTCSSFCKNKFIGLKLGSRTTGFDFKRKKCRLCKTAFEPQSGAQHWCKECVPDKAATKRAQRYGISQKDYDEFKLFQMGKCALCDNLFSVVDHDHNTEKVRGLLCNACNIALGRVEVVGWIEKALLYIKRGK